MRVTTQSRGFSLIEILIVIVILALAAMLSYPSIQSVMGEQALSNGTSKVLGAMQFGYLQAQGRGRSQVLRFTVSPDAPGGRIEFFETSGWSCSDPVSREGIDDVVLLDVGDGGSVAIVDVAPQSVLAGGICFKPSGRAYVGTGAVPVLEDGSYNAPRSSTIGVRLRRFSDLGTGLVVVGVKKEIHLIHSGIAQINMELVP